MKRLNIETLFSLGYKSEYPQRQLLMGYSVYSILGALILSFPFCCRDGISIVDNLFSAVSALSTTGLSTVDVSSDYTFWGQLVILLLIQLGGLGYMTFSSYVMFRLTRHLGTNEAKMFHAQFSFPDKMQSDNMLGNIVNFALAFEIMGVLLLYPYFLLHDVDNPLWSALFHSVSAFCTAGFSIFSDNLMQFQTDWYVNFVVAILSYMGAMGFIMMTDVLRKLRHHDYRILIYYKGYSRNHNWIDHLEHLAFVLRANASRIANDRQAACIMVSFHVCYHNRRFQHNRHEYGMCSDNDYPVILHVYRSLTVGHWRWTQIYHPLGLVRLYQEQARTQERHIAGRQQGANLPCGCSPDHCRVLHLNPRRGHLSANLIRRR